MIPLCDIYKGYIINIKITKNNNLREDTTLPSTVVHTCNPGYLGNTDWEDCGSRSAWVNI
jgi:hypothetical protein